MFGIGARSFNSRPEVPLLTRARVIKLLIAIAILVPLAYLGRQYYGELDRLRNAPPLLVLAIAVAYLAARAINGEVMRVCLRALGYSIGFAESWMLAILTSYANLLLPRVGTGMPAVYLKATRGVSFADFGSQGFVSTVLQVAAIGVIGLICEALLVTRYGASAPWPVTLSFAIALVTGLGLVFVRLPTRGEPKGRVGRILQKVGEGLAKLGTPRTVLIVTAWNVPLLLLRAWRVQLSFYAIGQPISYPAALLASLLGDLTLFVSVTPAALGFREAVISYSAPLLNTTHDVALAASILDRLIWSIIVIVISQFGMWRMIRPVLRKASADAADASARPPQSSAV